MLKSMVCRIVGYRSFRMVLIVSKDNNSERTVEGRRGGSV